MFVWSNEIVSVVEAGFLSFYSLMLGSLIRRRTFASTIRIIPPPQGKVALERDSLIYDS
jgi:hypothetical protein